jgi:hypothetical protein
MEKVENSCLDGGFNLLKTGIVNLRLNNHFELFHFFVLFGTLG